MHIKSEMATKTPVTILQELMVKRCSIPHYDFVDNDTVGIFHCKAAALSVKVIGKGRNKKDAKQDAAGLILEKLAQIGEYFPRECDNLNMPDKPGPEVSDSISNNVGFLKDFCHQYNLGAPDYICISDTGFAHSKKFTIQCKIGSVERVATSTTKKHGKQLAAGKLVDYFKEHLKEKIVEFEELQESFMSTTAQQNEDAKDKYLELSDIPWRPNLGQVISRYHYGLKEIIEKENVEEANIYISSRDTSLNPISHMEKVLEILKLAHEFENINEENTCFVVLLKIPRANPPAYLVGTGSTETSAKEKAALEALDYLKLMLNI